MDGGIIKSRIFKKQGQICIKVKFKSRIFKTRIDMHKGKIQIKNI